MIANRPDWCISRQRPWGVGIPVFYGKQSRVPVLDPVAIEAVAQLVEERGSDAWFEVPASEILPDGYVHPETEETEFVKETDVLDVWFDSGSTSLAVLEGEVEAAWREPWPADLYLEGSDQHRGWFNSSLIIGMATRGAPPYKAVVTHGFVDDSAGNKMSKRAGNAIDPVDVCDKFGADVLRYWVASVDWHNDAPVSDDLLKQVGDMYRTVRNTLRFLLGNLGDYREPYDGMLEDIDLWAIEQVDLLASDCARAYHEYDFGTVITGVHNFCAKELSRFYIDAIKDRMYCDGTDWPARRSAQRACHYVLLQLVRILAPILIHTAEEVYARIPAYGRLASVHLEVLAVPDERRLAEIEESAREARFAGLLSVRAEVFAAFESWKVEAGVKDSQDVVATISGSPSRLASLSQFAPPELANLFKMSWVEVNEGVEGDPIVAGFRPSEHPKCERSRLRRPDVKEFKSPDGAETALLTLRDARALAWA